MAPETYISQSLTRTHLLLLCIITILSTAISAFSTSSYGRQFRSMNNYCGKSPFHHWSSTKERQKVVSMLDRKSLTIFQSTEARSEWSEMVELLEYENDPIRMLQVSLPDDKRIDHKDIKRAYRRMARKFHPDMVADDHKKMANELFAKINVAYELLRSSATPAEMEEILGCEDAYKVLQMSPTNKINRDEVKKAFRKMVIRYHPDVVVDFGENKYLAKQVLHKLHLAAEHLLAFNKSFVQNGMGGAVPSSGSQKRRTYASTDGSASWGQRRPAANTKEPTASTTTTYTYTKTSRQASTRQAQASPPPHVKQPPKHQACETHWSTPRRHEVVVDNDTAPPRTRQTQTNPEDEFTSSYSSSTPRRHEVVVDDDTAPQRKRHTQTTPEDEFKSSYSRSTPRRHEVPVDDDPVTQRKRQVQTNPEDEFTSSYTRSTPRRHEVTVDDDTAPQRKRQAQTKSDDEFKSSYTPPHRVSSPPTGATGSNYKSPSRGATGVDYSSSFYAPHTTASSSFGRNTASRSSRGASTQGSTTNVSGRDFEERTLLWHIYGR